MRHFVIQKATYLSSILLTSHFDQISGKKYAETFAVGENI
jgi:hypothetical protein